MIIGSIIFSFPFIAKSTTSGAPIAAVPKGPVAAPSALPKAPLLTAATRAVSAAFAFFV